jgi:hypothetical protein
LSSRDRYNYKKITNVFSKLSSTSYFENIKNISDNYFLEVIGPSFKKASQAMTLFTKLSSSNYQNNIPRNNNLPVISKCTLDLNFMISSTLIIVEKSEMYLFKSRTRDPNVLVLDSKKKILEQGPQVQDLPPVVCISKHLLFDFMTCIGMNYKMFFARVVTCTRDPNTITFTRRSLVRWDLQPLGFRVPTLLFGSPCIKLELPRYRIQKFDFLKHYQLNKTNSWSVLNLDTVSNLIAVAPKFKERLLVSDPCGICFNRVKVPCATMCCFHVFCLDCINHPEIKICPICRTKPLVLTVIQDFIECINLVPWQIQMVLEIKKAIDTGKNVLLMLDCGNVKHIKNYLTRNNIIFNTGVTYSIKDSIAPKVSIIDEKSFLPCSIKGYSVVIDLVDRTNLTCHVKDRLLGRNLDHSINWITF